MERVTGIGGVFFRARDPEALVAWCAEHLGVPVTEGYAIFPERRNTVWSPFSQDTDYWPSAKHGMVNHLDAALTQLRAAGIEVDERIEDHEFGRFGWATDPTEHGPGHRHGDAGLTKPVAERRMDAGDRVRSARHAAD